MLKFKDNQGNVLFECERWATLQSRSRVPHWTSVRNWQIWWSDYTIAIYHPHGYYVTGYDNESSASLEDFLEMLPVSVKRYVQWIITVPWNRESSIEVTYDDSGLSSRTFGIELELCYPERLGSREDFCRKLSELSGVDVRFQGYTHEDSSTIWKGVTDGSLRSNPNTYTIEIVSRILKGREGLLEVNKICQALDDLNCSVNASCGFHVHHGASDMNVSKRLKVFSFYRRNEELFDSIVSRSRRGNDNSYCLSLTRYPEGTFPDTRYTKINPRAFERHRTIEFRQHQGTINYRKISNWIRLTQRVVEKSNTSTYTSLSSMLEGLGLFAIVEYYESRTRELA